jgi:hypothetical protein
VYLWHDPDGGWALRVTRSEPHDRTVFSGYLTSMNGRFPQVAAIMGSPADIVAVGPGKHTVYFRLVGSAAVDGLDFGTQCARAFTVDVDIAGSAAPTGEVHLGSGLAAPPSVPFRVERGNAVSADVRVISVAATTTTALPVSGHKGRLAERPLVSSAPATQLS